MVLIGVTCCCALARVLFNVFFPVAWVFKVVFYKLLCMCWGVQGDFNVAVELLGWFDWINMLLCSY